MLHFPYPSLLEKLHSLHICRFYHFLFSGLSTPVMHILFFYIIMYVSHWDLSCSTAVYTFVFSFLWPAWWYCLVKTCSWSVNYIVVCWLNLFCLFENPHRLTAISGGLSKPAFERLTLPQGWDSSLLRLWNFGRLDIESYQNPDDGDGVDPWNGGLRGPLAVTFNPRERYWICLDTCDF